jgi:O-antigen/teichoic acid export membrane protein
LRNSRVKLLFSSGLQAISVQVLGLAFFMLIALYLPKDDFGIINWANATAMMIAALLSCGLDQVVVRRVAASKTSDWAAAAYFAHALVGSAIILIVLFAINMFVVNSSLNLLRWFFLVQAIIYLATPLKQFLNAKQKFAPYAVIAILSNLIKLTVALLLIVKKELSIITVFYTLATCAVIEFAGLFLFIKAKTNLNFGFKTAAYKKLLKESFPQYLSVIFDSSLSRMDWILIGLLASKAITAEYAFAFRAVEIARLPITIIAPILLNVFASMLVNSKLDTTKQEQVKALYTFEIFIATIIPLCLNIVWSPLLDFISKGKYGSTNATEFMLLSICIPLQFAINLLWTLSFSSRRYKQTSFITIISAVSNLLLTFILIPLFGGIGAAISFCLTTCIQLGGYFILTRKHVVSLSLGSPIIFLAIASIAFLTGMLLTNIILLRLLIAISIYITAAILSKIINKNHLQTVRSLLRK